MFRLQKKKSPGHALPTYVSTLCEGYMTVPASAPYRQPPPPHSAAERQLTRGVEMRRREGWRRAAPSDGTLRRQLLHEPYPSAPPPRAHVPSNQHAQPSAEPVDGSQLPSPPPPAWGAAAPSSPPSPGFLPVFRKNRPDPKLLPFIPFCDTKNVCSS